MTTNTYLFDVYSPRGERFPIQGLKYLGMFLGEQPHEGIDWRIVARPLPSDSCRFLLVEKCYWKTSELVVLFMPHCYQPDDESLTPMKCHAAMLTAAEIGQEMGGN
jgi:hypothetical protein